MNARGVLSRFQEYIRYQSRYGYEAFMLPLSGLSVVALAVAIWWFMGADFTFSR